MHSCGGGYKIYNIIKSVRFIGESPPARARPFLFTALLLLRSLNFHFVLPGILKLHEGEGRSTPAILQVDIADRPVLIKHIFDVLGADVWRQVPHVDSAVVIAGWASDHPASGHEWRLITVSLFLIVKHTNKASNTVRVSPSFNSNTSNPFQNGASVLLFLNRFALRGTIPAAELKF